MSGNTHCAICKITFKTHASLQDCPSSSRVHIKKCVEFRCTQCNGFYLSEASLKRHKTRMHPYSSNGKLYHSSNLFLLKISIGENVIFELKIFQKDCNMSSDDCVNSQRRVSRITLKN